MPITVHDPEAELYGDAEHWAHVMAHLFIPAIEAAGYAHIVPSASGTSMIHGRIVKHLVEADMVLCDLSRHNPNVLFELGVRTALNRPVALVKDEHLKLPFDIQGLNTHHYASQLSPWTLDEQVTALAEHIANTAKASGSSNPLWEHFGVSISASQPPSSESPEDAKLQLILEKVQELAPTARPRRGANSRATLSRGTTGSIGTVVASIPGVTGASVHTYGDGRVHISISTVESTPEVQDLRTVEAAEAIVLATGVAAHVEGTSADEIRLEIPAPESLA